MTDNWMVKKLDITHPIILAPMFLVSNEEMIISAAKAGIIGCLPAHNYRKAKEFENGIIKIKEAVGNNFGINLIVNKSNLILEKQLEICLKHQPKFIITSLGSPKQIITNCKDKKILVFCDVVNYKQAIKVQELGADAVIGVNSGAGGHAGTIPASVLIPSLVNSLKIPVISAGGVGNRSGFQSMITLGATGLSIGTPFIATTECPVSNSYKEAMINSIADDIILTDRLSGTPCTFVRTSHISRKINNPLAPISVKLSRNRLTKKYFKAVMLITSMSSLKKSAMEDGKAQVWCAGPSLEFTTEILSIKNVIAKLV